MNDKIDTIVAGVNRKDEKMWGDFYDRFYTALCVYACYNNALLYIRNNQIHDTILNSLAEEESVEDEDMIYALTVKEEIIRQLYCYIEELPSEQRRIILMRIEGHTWEEIAERLEISINTVKTQKTRSYKFLRERLGDSVHSIILCLFL